MWRAGVVVVGILLVAGCWSSGPVSGSRLTIARQTGPSASELRPSVAELHCDGQAIATGYLRNSAGAACALVRRGVVEKVVAGQRSRRACTEIYGGPQRARITGTINGHRVDLTVTRTDGCGIADWQTLEPLLGDPQRAPGPDARSAPTTTTVPPIRYQVKRGDTMTGLATRFGVPIAAIVARNHLADPDHLAEGQQLLIPPAPPIGLVVAPPDAHAGTDFQLELTGAKPAETITFEIDTPDHKYTGPPHTPAADGVVTATYHSAIGDTSGTYVVTARGNQGTTARANFRIDSTTSTPAGGTG